MRRHVPEDDENAHRNLQQHEVKEAHYGTAGPLRQTPGCRFPAALQEQTEGCACHDEAEPSCFGSGCHGG